MNALLEVVTRAYKRPNMLAQNRASVARLGDNVGHAILPDYRGIGVAKANSLLADFKPSAMYVWVLDDDDLCVHDELASDIHWIARMHDNPPAVIVRVDHGDELGVLPDDLHWRQAPVEACIGTSAIITRWNVWMQHRHAWATERYAADYDFIASVWAAESERIVWHDVIAARCQRISHGQPEVA